MKKIFALLVLSILLIGCSQKNIENPMENIQKIEVKENLIEPLKLCSIEESRSLNEIYIKGDSMLPTLSERDRIFVNLSEKDFEIGDIIWFDSKEYNINISTSYLIHRVITINKESDGSIYYTTKGDNLTTNFYPDRFKVRSEDIKGIVICKK